MEDGIKTFASEGILVKTANTFAEIDPGRRFFVFDWFIVHTPFISYTHLMVLNLGLAWRAGTRHRRRRDG